MGKPSHGGAHTAAHITQQGPDPQSALLGPPHPHTTSPGTYRDSGTWAQESLTSCSFPSTWVAGTQGWLEQSQIRAPGKNHRNGYVRLSACLSSAGWGCGVSSCPPPCTPGSLEGSPQVGLASQEEGITGAEARLVDREGGMGLGECGAKLGKLRPRGNWGQCSHSRPWKGGQGLKALPGLPATLRRRDRRPLCQPLLPPQPWPLTCSLPPGHEAGRPPELLER